MSIRKTLMRWLLANVVDEIINGVERSYAAAVAREEAQMAQEKKRAPALDELRAEQRRLADAFNEISFAVTRAETDAERGIAAGPMTSQDIAQQNRRELEERIAAEEADDEALADEANEEAERIAAEDELTPEEITAERAERRAVREQQEAKPPQTDYRTRVMREQIVSIAGEPPRKVREEVIAGNRVVVGALFRGNSHTFLRIVEQLINEAEDLDKAVEEGRLDGDTASVLGDVLDAHMTAVDEGRDEAQAGFNDWLRAQARLQETLRLSVRYKIATAMLMEGQPAPVTPPQCANPNCTKH